MKRLCVFGIGSPFGDDRHGWEAIEMLRRSPLNLPGWHIEFDRLDRPGPGLLDRMEGADAVVLIDALCSGAEPGSVMPVDREALAQSGARYSSHALGVAEVLELGERLSALPERLLVIGIEAGGAVSDRLPEVFGQQVRGLLHDRH